MSNSQRRTEFRQRNKTYPGPSTPWDEAAQRERVRRLTHLDDLRRLAIEKPAITVPDEKEKIPTSGSGRRRAKAARNVEATAQR